MNPKEFILTKTLINSLYSFPQQNSVESTKQIQQKKSKHLKTDALVQRKSLEVKQNKSKYHSKSEKIGIQIIPQTPNSFIQPKKIDDDITPSMKSVEKDILMSKYEETGKI